MLEVLIGLALTYLILMGWLKFDMWRFNWSSERRGRRIREQAHRDYLARHRAISEYCDRRDAEHQQDLMARVAKATAGLSPAGPGPGCSRAIR